MTMRSCRSPPTTPHARRSPMSSARTSSRSTTGVRHLEPEARRQAALELAPRLRGRLGRNKRVVLTFDDSPPVLDFVSTSEAAGFSQVGPATPDHTIYTK